MVLLEVKLREKIMVAGYQNHTFHGATNFCNTTLYEDPRGRPLFIQVISEGELLIR